VKYSDVYVMGVRWLDDQETSSVKLAPVRVAVNVKVMKLMDLVGFTKISA
jgi:hypothetical protein